MIIQPYMKEKRTKNQPRIYTNNHEKNLYIKEGEKKKELATNKHE